jgi:uncharacterized protein YbjQ (UPF0145 family)
MDGEVTLLSQAYNNATHLAVSRLEQEATALGAHGVIGVRFELVRHEWADVLVPHEWAEKAVEVRLLGTAIAGPGGPPRTPRLSDLSGQEWWALRRAGYEPAGLVYGHCVWLVLTTEDDEWTERSATNQELRHRSTALHAARTCALQQVQAAARRAGAVGVVGVQLSRRLVERRMPIPGQDQANTREHHLLTFSIIGTAISLRPDAPKQVRATVPVLSLRDGRLTPYKANTVDARSE